jgi:transcriptional regulator of heat shock response
MDSSNNPIDIDLSEAEAAALIRGRKLGFLIAASTLPDDVKDELAALTEEMTEEQQNRLADVFEAKYLDEQTAEAEKKLKEELEALVKKYQAEDEARAKSLAAAIGQI